MPMHRTAGMIKLYNEDCMKLMARYPDKHFNLAIVDPPFGMGEHHQNNKQIANCKGYSYGARKKMRQWDKAPGKSYFNELFRVSKKQIIFGGNYFGLPKNRNFIVFYKSNIPDGFDFAQCEYAWTNIKGNSRIFEYYFHSKTSQNRFHPAQKPSQLYKWLLSRYTKPGYKILDTHLGSGTHALACIDMGFDLTASEIDSDYFENCLKMIKKHLLQINLFPLSDGCPIPELNLFD